LGIKGIQVCSNGAEGNTILQGEIIRDFLRACKWLKLSPFLKVKGRDFSQNDN
jgi:hypothetical protein